MGANWRCFGDHGCGCAPCSEHGVWGCDEAVCPAMGGFWRSEADYWYCEGAAATTATPSAPCSEHEMHNCNEEDCAALGGHDWSGSWRCEDHGCWCSRCSEHELHGCDQEKCAAMGGDDWSTTWRCEDMMGCHCARCSMHDVWGCEEAACSAFAEQDPAVRWHCDDSASGGGDGAPGRTRRKLAQKFIPEIHRLLQERVSIEKKRAVGKDRNLSETFGDSSRRLKKMLRSARQCVIFPGGDLVSVRPSFGEASSCEIQFW